MNLFEYFEQELSTDDGMTSERKSKKLKALYDAACDEEVTLLNDVFNTLCGWNLDTLIENSNSGEK